LPSPGLLTMFSFPRSNFLKTAPQSREVPVDEKLEGSQES